jgi:hypothetical protein
MSFATRFANLGHPNKIWVIAAIHGEAEQLVEVHRALSRRFKPGDRLVYTGNYIGSSRAGSTPAGRAALDEILRFQAEMLALPGLKPGDIVYLRGAQEELWGKLLQLPFAQDAGDIVTWIASRHPEVDALLGAYGSSLQDAARIAREGILSLTRWSTALKLRQREAGHEAFFLNLRLAAFTEHKTSNDNNLLFVHAGFDPARSLAGQGDGFWWGGKGFNAQAVPYRPFRTVVRGFDPEGQGIYLGNCSVSLDGGCGRGGRLVCAQLSNLGDVLDIFSK